MQFFVKIKNLLRNLFLSRQVEVDLDQEVHSHLEMLTQEYIRAGMSPEEAKRSARIELGGIEQVKEQVREERMGNWLQSVLLDCRYGLRQLRKNPGFTAVAVLTLALGIAVNTTMFSMVSAFLLRRPPGHDPERVAVITSVNPARGFQPDTNPISVPNYLAWREANHVFAETAAADEYRTVSLASQGQPEALPSMAVTPNYFNVLGVSPLLGRTFVDGEDQAGDDHVVILSDELWKRRFGSDASMIGRTIRLNRLDYAVVGVMPPSFRLLGRTPQLWTPLVLTAADQTAAARRDHSLRIFARLKPSVSIEQARAELSTLAHRAEENFPETEKGWGVAVRTLPDFLIHDFGIRSALAVIMITVSFVLLIACANVAGLLLARATGRRKELALRIALGAGRMRIIRQLLTENLLIAFFGCCLSLVLANWGIFAVRAGLNFNEAISDVPLGLDGNVLLFAIAVSLACAMLCGLAPALSASRTDVNKNLQDQSRGASQSRSQSRLRTVMVTGEIALALFLLIGAGLLFRGIFLVEHQNLGFRADPLLTANVTLDEAHYKDPGQQSLFIRGVLQRVRQIPGVEAVAAASDLPSTGPGSATFRIKSQTDAPNNQPRSALDVVATVDYFRAAGIPLLRGRIFAETDGPTAPNVVLVNQEFVRHNLPGQEPLGKEIQLDVGGAPPEWSEIIGVVGDVKSYSEGTRVEPQVYEPFLQRPVPSFSLMVRTASDPDSLASALRNAVANVDPELPLDRVMSMPAVIVHQRYGNQFFVGVLGSFALLALILSAIGIYGLVAFSVGQRTHEIGIRMALGASTPDVLRMVLWEGMKTALIGAAIGLSLALPLPKVFAAIFFDLYVGEPQLYFIVPVVIFAVAMLATYIPAWRASRVDPVIALHQE
jgi:predicted permease